MKFGVREICDVVLRAKSAQKIGNKIFYKNEPVIYFDTLKTSSMEGAATTVYAQGGRGNARLVAWEGERTVTFHGRCFNFSRRIHDSIWCRTY